MEIRTNIPTPIGVKLLAVDHIREVVRQGFFFDGEGEATVRFEEANEVCCADLGSEHVALAPLAEEADDDAVHGVLLGRIEIVGAEIVCVEVVKEALLLLLGGGGIGEEGFDTWSAFGGRLRTEVRRTGRPTPLHVVCGDTG